VHGGGGSTEVFLKALMAVGPVVTVVDQEAVVSVPVVWAVERQMMSRKSAGTI
jgi:hypothetical protein